MFLILTMKRINVEKCINLNLKNILENSSGKRKWSYLIFPIDNGNKIYCSKKEVKEILLANPIKKKNRIIVVDPNTPQIIFLMSKLKAKYNKDKKTIIKKKWPVGVCFVRNEVNKKIGKKNQ